MKSPALFVSLLFVVSFGPACRPATQVTFDITSNLPCSEISGTAISAGLENETERAEPVAVTTSCAADGTVAAIGTYALRPAQLGKTLVGVFKVTAAVGSGVDVDRDCRASKGYVGCIVARRRVSFVANRTLRVPVQLNRACLGVQCDENTTCTQAGTCGSAEVDTSACSQADLCDQLVTMPGAGLPCFNSATVNPLFCQGNTAWCTRSAEGVRACATAPAAGGVSFQCRTSSDCGPALKCVPGTNGVLGQCVPSFVATEVILCTPESAAECAPNTGGCKTDAGEGLSTCIAPFLSGDGGLPCPADGGLRCGGPKPFCDIAQSPPACVADGGSECWVSSQCPVGKACFSTDGGTSANFCAAGADSGVRLCDLAIGDTDCPQGEFCIDQGNNRGLCQQLCLPGMPNCYGTGKDGPLVVPSNTQVTVNRETALSMAVSSGATTLAVVDSTGFAPNDLVMVWQPDGFPGQAQTGDSSPVNIIDAGSVGLYEFARVASLPSMTSVVLATPLTRTYAGGLVTSVPEYTTVTVEVDAGLLVPVTPNSGVPSPHAVVFVATGVVTNNGTIGANGSGFIGGQPIPNSSLTGCAALSGDATAGGGAMTGVGVGGGMSLGRGRVGNAGGGGNCLNAGGGGGGLGGAGGKGGASSPDDGYRDVGGFPGSAVILGLNQLTFGAGAGAGQANSMGSSSGGAGGGLILIAAASITGNGVFTAQGDAAPISGVDGLGGGGSGGLIELRTAGSLQCSNLNVAGGLGQKASEKYGSYEGGGGGGGGGGGIIRLYAGDHQAGATCPGTVSGGATIDEPAFPLLRGSPGTAGVQVRR